MKANTISVARFDVLKPVSDTAYGLNVVAALSQLAAQPDDVYIDTAACQVDARVRHAVPQ